MKQISMILILVICLVLAACMPQAPLPSQLPIDTIVALTMATLPRTSTPTPAPTEPPTETPTPAPAATLAAVIAQIPGADCLPAGERQTARVSRILDASTIEVAINNAAFQVRYIGIEAPSTSKPSLAMLAAGRNRDLVEGKIVTMVKDAADTDSEGHWLRYVVVGNVFVNLELVKQGYARSAPQAPNLACQKVLDGVQALAQNNETGLWAPTPAPTTTIRPTRAAGMEPTSFPTAVPAAACNCEGPKLRCKDFDTHHQAQACYNYCNKNGYDDVFGLDKDGSGTVCKGLP